MKWKYHRLNKSKCSKWVLGTSWVTKFDAGIVCHVGLEGIKYGIMEITPRKAREFVERAIAALHPPQQKGDAGK